MLRSDGYRQNQDAATRYHKQKSVLYAKYRIRVIQKATQYIHKTDTFDETAVKHGTKTAQLRKIWILLTGCRITVRYQRGPNREC